MKLKKRTNRIMLIIIGIILLLLIYVGAKTWVAVGKLPTGERLERVKQSSHYNGKEFVNTIETREVTAEDGTLKAWWNFLFKKVKDLNPSSPIPSEKMDLKNIGREEEIVVWLGHSSVFIQTNGKRYLFDPVLESGLPVSLYMNAYKGSNTYHAEDIPEVDYLIITHNHFDHLDYPTVKKMKDKVKNVVCALGIGESFEYWGYDKEKIHDLDWGESIQVDETTKLYCLPARHFSGRLYGNNKTFWTSYMIAGEKNIYVTGDSGYDEHYKEVKEQFPEIDLAIMENGQYDKDWKDIHTMPEELVKELETLQPKKVLTYHNSKFTLGKHAWYEPLELIYKASQGKPYKLLTPKIGEKVQLDHDQTFSTWWRK